MLIGGIVLYIVTSAFCALSTSIEALIVFCFLHALGSGAGMVITRAVVRDLFDTAGAARALSLMMLVMGARRCLRRWSAGSFPPCLVGARSFGCSTALA